MRKFQEFYEDLFLELSKYGEIESLNVCDNLADHMVCTLRLFFNYSFTYLLGFFSSLKLKFRILNFIWTGGKCVRSVQGGRTRCKCNQELEWKILCWLVLVSF